MKTKDLDIDFIGGQGPLTKEEEQAISEYLKKKKEKSKKSKSRKRQAEKDKSNT
ncbi:hypothetical protein WJR50_04420 [Catalinimonas sp. 4WD22]|uniref:hypothetical protein n=1 Tax=Catalinimonas locisalis TaxID=3133978 RepID=UPI00310199CD